MNEMTRNTRGNALATPANTQKREAVSVFDDADTFQSAYKMAVALSKTALVPKQFQGKPEDCLVALDYARRLGITPTAIMPHLFCVYGTPSMSVQMMIALVNRSGKFTRVAWDEGTDGTIKYAGLGGKTVEIPNLYACAYFTELSTKTKIISPRVDMQMALINGWLTKGHDKNQLSPWEKIPQTMLRWRSASMLIKATCPELTLGLESTEDVRDGVGTTEANVELAPEHAAVEMTAVQAPAEDPIDQILDAIQAAPTAEALNALAQDINRAGFAEEQLARIRPAFIARRDELQEQENADEE